jgi:hypothetical protein
MPFSERLSPRFEAGVETRASAKLSSLANDNVQQRQAALTTKLAAHEQSRVFYMPDFTPPPEDAAKPAEKTPLYLPSGLSTSDRERYCKISLIEAELEVRLASMLSSLEELLRNLCTRTFLSTLSGVKHPRRICEYEGM